MLPRGDIQKRENKELEKLERKDIEQDEKIIVIFEYLKQLEQLKQFISDTAESLKKHECSWPDPKGDSCRYHLS